VVQQKTANPRFADSDQVRDPSDSTEERLIRKKKPQRYRAKRSFVSMGDELWSCHVKIYLAENAVPVSECDVFVTFSELTLQNNEGLRIHSLKLDELADLERAFVSRAIDDVLSERFEFSRCQKTQIKPQHAATPSRAFAIQASNGALVWLKE
jgi:hypothetical protein